MPYPIGHAAVGIATYVIVTKGAGFTGSEWLGTVMFISIIANLPDVDFIFGLIVSGNGSKFHGGVTHTIYFSVLAGYFIFLAGKYLAFIPNIGFFPAFLVILSHPIIDRAGALISANTASSAISALKPLIWPRLYSTDSYSGFWDIVTKILIQSLEDYKIILGSIVVAIIILLVKRLL